MITSIRAVALAFALMASQYATVDNNAVSAYVFVVVCLSCYLYVSLEASQ